MFQPGLSGEGQAQGDQQLADIVQADIRHAQALLRFGAEGVQDQNDIARQEEQRSCRKQAGKAGGRSDQIRYGHTVEQHDRADVDHTENFECLLL